MSETTKTKSKPCFRCGSSNLLCAQYETTKWWVAGCQDCMIRTGYHMTKQEAIEDWNKPTLQSALLEAAEEVLKEGCNAKRCAFPPSVEIPNCKKCPMAKLKAAVENAKGIIPPVS